MKEHGNTKHGHARRQNRSRTWLTWASMIRRCTMPSQDNYRLYGGRGIKVCERWQDFTNFLQDMGEIPEGLSIDRIDPNGNYEPQNCRWATAKEQKRNQRRSRRIMHQGLNLMPAEWEERTGISSTMIRSRIDKLGWSIERALTEPAISAAVSSAKARSMKRKMPVSEFITAIKNGESGAQIARRYGVSSSTVTKALKRAGVLAGQYSQTTEARRARVFARLA